MDIGINNGLDHNRNRLRDEIVEEEEKKRGRRDESLESGNMHHSRVRSISPMSRASRFGEPKVKNLPIGKRDENWTIEVIGEMVLKYLKHFVPPVFGWAPKYQLRWFLNDLLAGLSSGVYGIPQCMALGVLAGLTPVEGLYASLAPSIVYILLGPSRSVSIGPSSVGSLMVGGAVMGSKNPALMATTLAFFMGVIFLALGLLRVGFLASLISRPVVVGYTAAAALIVDSTQVKHILGLKGVASHSNIIQFFQIYIPAIKKGPINGWATIISLTSLFVLISMAKFLPKRLKSIPAPVLVTILSILITWGFKLNINAGITIVGDIPSGLPVPSMPFVDSKELASIAPSLIVISAISIVELVSISKTFAVKVGTTVNTNTELVAVGAAAIIGSFFKTYPISASFSRTALNHNAGAKSQLSNVVRN
jgi:SulP family sulfate permease